MIVKRFFDDRLAQASYLIGCGQHGVAVVIDANRDIEQYVRAAEAEHVSITHTTETHIHADFVSGSRELALRTGATLYLSDEGDENWKYAFADSDNAILLRHGNVFKVGNVRIEVVHTPGHTPEHISFLVTDAATATEPIAIVTGDFVFVGDVGRPDLLEKAAHIQGTMEASARTLFRSLQKFKEYPDWLQIWPGHGAGSACGKGLSAVPHSTVGYERQFNWAFDIVDENEFVRIVLDGQPEPPKYFAEMKRINKEGPKVLNGFQRPALLSYAQFESLLAARALVVDTRAIRQFASAFVPGTFNIPLTRSFNTWAGWLLPYTSDFYLIVDESCDNCIDDAVRALAMVGLDRIAGYFTSHVVDEWGARHELASIPEVSAEDVVAGRVSGTLVDVREDSEWRGGHLPGARHMHLGYLADNLDSFDKEDPMVLYCQSGSRSAIGASVLHAHGFRNVTHLAGGYSAWRAAGGTP